MAKFELVSKYVGSPELIPTRGTASSAGYDLTVAEDIIIPSYQNLCEDMVVKPFLRMAFPVEEGIEEIEKEKAEEIANDLKVTPRSLVSMAELTKELKTKPTLVPTGIKCALAPDEYLSIVARSSTPLKYWLIVANAPGTIDADYYNNPDNEGHIFVQLINLSPYNIQLNKGDKIAQAIIQKYYTTEDDIAGGMRVGGFGSTS